MLAIREAIGSPPTRKYPDRSKDLATSRIGGHATRTHKPPSSNCLLYGKAGAAS